MPIISIRHFHEITRYTLDLLFPPRCVLCQHTGSVLCSACQHQLQPRSCARCTHCHAALTTRGLCTTCSIQPLRLSGLRTVDSYQGPLRQCIHALKYKGETRLAQPLGALLAQIYLTHGMQADCLIPLPLHETRQKQRGYNHAALLARACAEHLELPVYEHLVTRHRPTQAQTQLSFEERHKNMQGAFQYLPACTTEDIVQRNIIIIDDVCTTGATLEACAETLFAAGASSVWGLVLARTGYIDKE